MRAARKALHDQKIKQIKDSNPWWDRAGGDEQAPKKFPIYHQCQGPKRHQLARSHREELRMF